ncbi:hypothetical protein EELLY_v1c04090 [Entomoplasma ellychniae]|uniref:Uncharacterized protein n=1 Tax=Entomoplasma ellychniae TaxID=2114 RepID=A0A8E2QYE7_9MOLU|nr:hypothetical protein [Entomoplasma ellychniae]PPE04729.1 hypothetical protein EELLY_v1c04090 [Entomoplasma ellychniae]
MIFLLKIVFVSFLSSSSTIIPVIPIAKKSNISNIAKVESQLLTNKSENNGNVLNQRIFKEGNDSDIIDHFGTLKEISTFSNLVPNYEFFMNLKSNHNLGYTSISEEDPHKKDGDFILPNDRGLCEYVSLTSLINYFQVFWKKDYYTLGQIPDNMYKGQKFKYIKNPEYYGEFDYTKIQPKRIIEPYIKVALPHEESFYDVFSRKEIVHKNYGDGNMKAVPYKIWEKNNRNKNMRVGSSMRSALKNWLGNNKNQIIDDYSASWWHTSEPESWLIKYKVPVLLSFWTKGFAHNVLIYGYDKATQSYAVNFGWPYSQYAISIIKKKTIWSTFSTGFWYSFREKE